MLEEFRSNPTLRSVAQAFVLASILAQTWVAISVIVELIGFFLDPR